MLATTATQSSVNAIVWTHVTTQAQNVMVQPARAFAEQAQKTRA